MNVPRSRPNSRSRRNLAAVVLAALACPSCAHAAPESRDVVLQVHGLRVPCTGLVPMTCLQVRRGREAAGEWQNFYAGIEGFTHESGYRYLIRVRETPLPRGQVPADASSIRYELLEVIDRSPDPVVALHDIWALRSVDGMDVTAFDAAMRVAQPYVEFHVTRGRYLGNDGCRAFSGEIIAAEPQALRLGPAQFDEAEATCGDGLLQERLRAALDRVAGWQREGPVLALVDSRGAEILRFGKGD